MSLRIAFTISAPRAMTLTAGREEIDPAPADQADDPPFLNIGRASGDEIHVSGSLIGDLSRLESTLAVDWYLPDEEPAEAARPVDLGGARLFVTVLGSRPAEPGWRRRYLLESSRPARETRFFEGGFHPPLRAEDLTLHLVHLIHFNYDGHILAGLDYLHRPAAYVEAEWRPPLVEAGGYLD